MQALESVKELLLLDGKKAARIVCAKSLCPAPGRYLLAHLEGSDAPLPLPIFAAKFFADGFLVAPPVPDSWTAGARLSLRGPLGRGFELSLGARHVALISFEESPGQLMSLLDRAVKQGSEVALVCKRPPEGLPLEVEIQPIEAFADVCSWADYIAIDAAREFLPELRTILNESGVAKKGPEPQILVHTPMPCGGIAECGVCAVEGRNGYKLACDDGPVFELRELI